MRRCLLKGNNVPLLIMSLELFLYQEKLIISNYADEEDDFMVSLVKQIILAKVKNYSCLGVKVYLGGSDVILVL